MHAAKQKAAGSLHDSPSMFPALNIVLCDMPVFEKIQAHFKPTVFSQ